jgi:hypothetical protein
MNFLLKCSNPRKRCQLEQEQKNKRGIKQVTSFLLLSVVRLKNRRVIVQKWENKMKKEKTGARKIFGRKNQTNARKMSFKGSCQSNSLKDSGNKSDKEEEQDEEGKRKSMERGASG